ncbi:unnamed protein product [Brassica oleracea]|uniref:Uncharacterized protein n=2 Tax=Brassica oleracea TaxID=3712 RepID=A0A0D3DMZ4_BRAOL|nr:unnamed protein product [Brassica oleracea]
MSRDVCLIGITWDGLVSSRLQHSCLHCRLCYSSFKWMDFCLHFGWLMWIGLKLSWNFIV